MTSSTGRSTGFCGVASPIGASHLPHDEESSQRQAELTCRRGTATSSTWRTTDRAAVRWRERQGGWGSPGSAGSPMPVRLLDGGPALRCRRGNRPGSCRCTAATRAGRSAPLTRARWRRLSVSADGTGVVAHAGSVAVRLLADRSGLTKELGKATARRLFVPVHDRGQVLVDVAVMLADGGEAIGGINVLRHQGQVLGPVASAPTVWRALDELTPAALKRIEVEPSSLGSPWRPPSVSPITLSDLTVCSDRSVTAFYKHDSACRGRCRRHFYGFRSLRSSQWAVARVQARLDAEA